jgi:hypothetical protein
MLSNFFSSENRTIHEVMWKNVVEPDRSQKKIYTAHALCMLDTDTRSEYVTVVAFPRQQWLRGDASVLRHKDIACLIIQEILKHDEEVPNGTSFMTCFMEIGSFFKS